MGNNSSLLQEEGQNDLLKFKENSPKSTDVPTNTTKTFENKLKLSHEDSISNFLVVNPNLIVTGSFDHTIKVWNLKEKHFQLLSNHPKEYITCLDKIDDNTIVRKKTF
jgi:WD40 repeat protein